MDENILANTKHKTKQTESGSISFTHFPHSSTKEIRSSGWNSLHANIISCRNTNHHRLNTAISTTVDIFNYRQANHHLLNTALSIIILRHWWVSYKKITKKHAYIKPTNVRGGTKWQLRSYRNVDSFQNLTINTQTKTIYITAMG